MTDTDESTRRKFDRSADESGEPTADESEPLAALASSVADSSADDPPNGDPFDDLFDREDITAIDGQALWDRLESDALSDVDGDHCEVEKRSYCHQCEHFAEPPTVACTHDGTEILAMPTLETFRVVDCPVVREEKAIERGYGRRE
ncbi:hypothetical protein [Natrarchaeobius oligotrophus]|uniref:DUF8135 domain-containing protein n=1 Tax=Natrarchaeobius chitinivorans TaxID=1679083 RepID=A0A3N6NHB8_NATCH|nr:hypothetical protein [Natrarchaeobius chitinivorans]RQG98472.1 hypothetical protein EA472_17815 [Natrarchaeobius chitinivorans]